MSPNGTPDRGGWARTLRARTAPQPAAVARVRSRLDLQLTPATAELSHLPEPSAAAVRRVRARIGDPRGSTAPAWGVRALGVGLGVAAMAMVVGAATLGDLGGDGGVSARALAGGGHEALAEHVVATWDGEGLVQSGPDGVVIDWELGRLELDVARGAAVRVDTPEGSVRVSGTRLTVERDALGTAVSVADGAADVACSGAAEQALAPGDDHACWPTTAAGLLNRARTLSERGATPEDVLAAADRGLALADDAPVRGELAALRLGALVTAGRDAEALIAAEEALIGADGARAEEVRRVAARLALRLGRCDQARAFADGLAADAAERALTEACR